MAPYGNSAIWRNMAMAPYGEAPFKWHHMVMAPFSAPYGGKNYADAIFVKMAQ